MSLLPRSGDEWWVFLALFVMASIFVDNAIWLYDHAVGWRTILSGAMAGSMVTVLFLQLYLLRGRRI